MHDFIFNALELIRNEAPVFIAISVIYGLLIGSFLNVVIYRLPIMMEREWQRAINESNPEHTEAIHEPTYNLTWPRSACPSCGHKITAWENIPIFSFLFLGGKCSGCKTKISMRYPLIEALTGLLTGLISWKFGFTGVTLAACLFTWSLIALTFIDFDTQLLPDDITLPLVWVGLLFNLNHGFTDIQSAVVGAVAGYLILWSIFWAFKLATGREGMGYGDFKLLAAIGAWFGWQMLPAVILLSSVAGSVVGIALIVLARHGRNVPIPFGPYLAMGGIAALFYGPQLSAFYLGA